MRPKIAQLIRIKAAGAIVLAATMTLPFLPMSAVAATFVFDFESLAEGHILSDGDFGLGITLEVRNQKPGHPDEAIIFDSACPGGCSGGDTDLQTPGYGIGNNQPQGKVMIIAEDVVDTSPSDGLVDDPDDEAKGGKIILYLANPMKLISARVLDVDTQSSGSWIKAKKVAGGAEVVHFALLGDNSAQTVNIPDPQLVYEIEIKFAGSGAIDDLVFADACGDGVVDSGEDCDDGNTVSGDCCSATCTAEPAGGACDDGDVCTATGSCNGSGVCVGSGTNCGDGILDPSCGEVCDDGNTAGGDCCSSTCQPELAGSVCGDDGNICTDDVCDGSATCQHVANTASCDDGDACTVVDVCDAGICGGGSPRVCDDGNACTDDTCDSQQGCVFTNNVASCDDGNACTVGDVCSAGSCSSGGPLDCNDGDVCTDDTCDPQQGCTYSDNTAPCNDGDACTVSDVCSAGTCQGGSVLTCDDSNGCTNDSCDSQSGCVFVDNTASCDDGNACTTGDTCSGGSCMGGAPQSCDDGDVCTDDACDVQQGCVYTNNTASCDDGDACTTADTCSLGSCQGGTPLSCNDGNFCTNDSCDAGSGCVFTDNTDPCDDGNACTTGDTCGNGTCNGGAPPSCDDGDICTDDSCDSQQGCVNGFNTASCDDGDACTTADACWFGSCQGGDPLSCSDGNGCTDDSCDSGSGCVFTNNAASCDDGNACTTADSCSGGSCTGGAPLACSDGDVCTDDSCDTQSGCLYTNNTAPCDDTDACTTADACSGGICTGGAPLSCSDGNGCTDDSCDSGSGCVFTNNTASCDDGNACTTADTCSGGSCTGGAPLACSDGDICTDDSCDTQSGCLYTNNTAPCDDSDACTTADACSGGICTGGAPLSCSDANVCTDDTCDTGSGCAYPPNTDSCDNGNSFDDPDVCSDGVCEGQGGCQGNDANCDDLNSCTDDVCLGSGACQHTNNTASCDDGNACTTGDTCGGGSCNGGAPPNCDDSDVCTDDTCDAQSGCVYTNNIAPCDDGDACTTADACAAGACQGGAPLSCSDGNGCTDDSCNSGSGCVFTNNTASCDDGNACTTSDTCGGGTCNGGAAPNCDDGDVCTDDTCDSLTGCGHADNTAPCDDGDACTTADACSAGTCQGGAGLGCDDGNACTEDTCDSLTGCGYTNNTASCDDGNACTTGDTCGGGICNGGAPPNCDDGNACTDDICDSLTGCGYTDNTAPCDDGDACTESDACSAGICQGGSALTCDDGNGCTDNSCDSLSGCVFTDNTASCDDGNACTTGDTCGGGACNGGAAQNCDDGNVCTNDVCDTQTGCTYSHNTAPCQDGNECTTADTCAAGSCQGGPPLVCSDGNVCTDDTCDSQQGCLYPDNTASCDDGDACTEGDTCGGGTCSSGSTLSCDDGDVCTDDSCDSQQGCLYSNNTAPCDDGDACTVADMCSGGSCLAGGPAVCDDSNVCTDDSCDSLQGCVFVANTGSCDDNDVCTEGDTCSGGSCVGSSALTCDDSNLCTDDNCDPQGGCFFIANNSPCDDGAFCNGTDTCSLGVCLHSGNPCLGGETCNAFCNEGETSCFNPVGTACNDADACTLNDQCDGAGTCAGGVGSTCGDGFVQDICGEQCDPPDGTTCNPDCTVIPRCGDAFVNPNCIAGNLDAACGTDADCDTTEGAGDGVCRFEGCDDGNEILGDGCHNCIIDSEDLVCFQGHNAQPGKGAKVVVFESSGDFVGENADGNQEIFRFSRKNFRKLVKKGFDLVTARDQSMMQITQTTSVDPEVDNINESPTLNGSGRFVAFVSNADITGENPDGNKEIFHIDIKREEITQVTNSSGIENLHPNLRAFRGKLLLFDSPGNLVPDRCVGGENDLELCASDNDCAGVICGDPTECPAAPAKCGNASENREVFEWLRKVKVGGVQMRQLTDADEGISTVGRSVNFFTRAAAFASTSDLLANKPPQSANSREIFRIVKRAENIDQITQLTESDFVSESPSQSKKRIVVFASDADLDAGRNPDGNMEVFLWNERAPGQQFSQVTDTVGCNNSLPTVGARGGFVSFQSTCDLIESGQNPGQSVFIYDKKRAGFLGGLMLRSPGNGDSSRPSVTRNVKVVTFEADPGGLSPNVVCLFNVKKEIFDGAIIQP